MRRRLAVPRRALVVCIGVAAALLLGFLWLRDSSLVAVEHVAVRGATGPDAAKVRAALQEAAGEMTTLRVDEDELMAAVDPYPIVGDVKVRRDLPNGLALDVVQRTPVAVVEVGGREVPLTSEGRLLHGATPGDLPKLALERTPSGRVDDPEGRKLVAVVAAAPAPLRERARRAFLGERGLTLEMEEGPELYFGSDDALEVKWAAAARVLADPSAEGAQYIDLREPGRPAAGGLAPLTPPDPLEEELPVEPTPVAGPDPLAEPTAPEIPSVTPQTTTP